MPVKRKSCDERKVLDYGDVLLREQDVSLLEGQYWLNDQIVAFFFEFLQREGYHTSPTEPLTPGSVQTRATPPTIICNTPQQQQQQQPRQGADSLLLLPPSTAFLLMHSPPKMAAEVLAPLKPSERGLVVLPVNDNDRVDVAAGGGHWSLLVYHRPSNTLRHYDSSPAASASGRSSRAARKLAEAVRSVLGSGAAAAQPRLVEVPYMPRQTNGYDCGVYLLAVARSVCQWWMRGPQGAEAGQEEAEAEWEAQERGLAAWLTPAYVAGLRAEVLKVIRTKAATAIGAGGPTEAGSA